MKELKQHLKQSLPELLAPYEPLLRECDERLWSYCQYVLQEEDVSCVWELCALRDFVRKLDHPDIFFHPDKVAKKIAALEKLPSDTMRGTATIKATMQQVYILANIYGFYWWVNTKQRSEWHKILPTEEVRDGEIWDYRLLTTDADLFIPRKFGKTFIAGFAMFNSFFTSVDDFEGYCCANAAAQAKRLYQQAKDFIRAVLPKDQDLVRFTATETNWVEGNKYGKKGSINLLSAGGKAKDGLKASLRCADEFGSASFVKDHSDMGNLVAVIDSSMGPRREPLRLTTTTAGRISSGPYMLRLEQLKQALKEGTMPMNTFAYLLQPDPWELQDEEELLTNPSIWRKVNPHIGVTVQSDFYENEIKRGRMDPDYMKEVMTKLFNVFQNDKAVDWITAQDIQKLTTPLTVEDCRAEDGWLCFVGMDFSKGDDLNAMAYFCVNPQTNQFFIDCDAWINEDSLMNSTNSVLYQLWKEQGWLHVCKGKVIDEMEVVERINKIYESVNILQFGYDPYDAKRFTNAIAAWVFANGGDPKQMLVGVKQTWANFNSAVQEMDYLVKKEHQSLSVSQNPLIPWCFGNCVLAESSDGMGNNKPIKRTHNAKIDVAICALEGLILFDNLNGKVH